MRIISRTPRETSPITLGILFAIAGGITFFAWGLPPLQYSNTPKSWPSVQGTITRLETDTCISDGNTLYQTDLVYAYIVDGKRYTSTKITVVDPSNDNSIYPPKHIEQEYPVGKHVDVYYNPEAPASSTLKSGIKTDDLVLAAITLLFLVVGLLVLFNGLREKRRAREVKYLGIIQS